LPVFAVGAAYALDRLAARLPRRQTALAGVLFLAASVPGLIGSIRSDWFFRQTDTRTLAREFIEREVPPGSSIMIQPHGVNLRPSPESLIDALNANLGSVDRASAKFQIQLGLSPYPAPAYRLFYLGEGGQDADKIYVSPRAFQPASGLEPLHDLRVQYVVMKRYNVEDPVLAPLQAALVRRARLIARFSPYAAGVGADRREAVTPFFHNTAARIDSGLDRPGPIVEIWRIDS
jgi:hypothetical protein